jgi:hypothetical protein
MTRDWPAWSLGQFRSKVVEFAHCYSRLLSLPAFSHELMINGQYEIHAIRAILTNPEQSEPRK